MKMTKKIAAILMAALMLCCAFASTASAAIPVYEYKAVITATNGYNAGYNGYAKVHIYRTESDMNNDVNWVNISNDPNSTLYYLELKFQNGRAKISFEATGVKGAPNVLYYRMEKKPGVTYYRGDSYVPTDRGKIRPTYVRDLN